MRSLRWMVIAFAVLLLAGCAGNRAESESQYEGYVDAASLVVAQEETADNGAEPEKPATETVVPPENEPPVDEESAAPPESEQETSPEDPVAEHPEIDMTEETVALSQAPAAVPEIAVTKASGLREQRSEQAVIDYSHTEDGYVMVQYSAETNQRVKAQVKGPSTTYTYNVAPGAWEVFPLSDGNGAYQVVVYENVTGTKYAAVISVSFDVQLKDEFAPFLLPNQYVNYGAAAKTVACAAELAGGEPDALKKVELVYSFVVDSLTYDAQKASLVKSGYLPVLDRVLEEKRGICFDYAALMAGMLRSQGVPCKLVVGYSGTAYHAWISVWTEETGWVDGAIFFDGTTWQRMDPTFASSGKRSESIMAYIGDGKNYTEKYLY